MFSASFPLNLTLCWTFNIFERGGGEKGGCKRVETNMLTGGVVTKVALDFCLSSPEQWGRRVNPHF